MHQSSTVHLGHPVIKRHPIRSTYNSKTRNRGNSNLLWRITVIVFNIPFPYTYHFPKTFKKSVEPRHSQVTTQFIKFEPVPIYLELSFILHTKSLLFSFYGNTWSKNFQNTKNFFTSFKKNVNNKHTFFEFMSSGSVHPQPPRERLHSGRETWLSTVERTSVLSKVQS